MCVPARPRTDRGALAPQRSELARQGRRIILRASLLTDDDIRLAASRSFSACITLILFTMPRNGSLRRKKANNAAAGACPPPLSPALFPCHADMPFKGTATLPSRFNITPTSLHASQTAHQAAPAIMTTEIRDSRPEDGLVLPKSAPALRRKQSSPMMPPFMVSAPGKVIVYGEHAVVHGKVRPCSFRFGYAC